MNIAIIGAGAWGCALAALLDENGHSVALWSRNAECLAEIHRSRRNERHLPGITLPATLRLEPDLDAAIHGAGLIVIALLSGAVREVSSALASFNGIVVSVTKGIEYETGLPMSGILKQTMPRAIPAALSGPTLAMEIIRGIPSAVVAASEDPAAAAIVQETFHRPTFRVYSSDDLAGVELGGALKNVIAIAAGACDGMGFGDNSKAALITRGLGEIRRLGVARGAREQTFYGLSGLGDLTVTCFSKLSRNRAFGERLGRGETVPAILDSSATIPEGYPTARSAVRLARELNVEIPIISEIHAVLHDHKSIQEAVRNLTERESRPE